MSFHSFVVGRQSKAGLSEVVELSRTTLWRRFLPFWNLTISPKLVNELFPVSQVSLWVLGLDGMWLHRFGAVMIYRDVTNQTNLWWSWQASESYQNLLEDFYQVFLLTKQVCPSGIVSDWKGAIVSLVGAFFPGVPHQRCLAHLIREGKRLLPAGSPFEFTLKLRRIVEEVIFIKDPADYFDWSQKLERWQKHYGGLLKVRTINEGTEKRWWYTHGNLRRAIRLLTKDQGNLFKFLHHDFLPNTNNSLEGVNSQLKRKLGTHRGMKEIQQVAFVFWCLAFSRTKTRADLVKLWDEIKKRL
ncbi:hypothetical protein HY405_00320 [Candidatus Microgenomates bacterium]|nr:hypothetical protein [Candidatus Microgenomates bacterium]